MLNKEERNINHNKTTRRAGYKKVYEHLCWLGLLHFWEKYAAALAP